MVGDILALRENYPSGGGNIVENLIAVLISIHIFKMRGINMVKTRLHMK